MFNPCKPCLVRVSCSQDCEDFKKFIDRFSIVAAAFSVIFSSIFTIWVLYLGDVFSGTPDKDFLSVIWIISVALGIYLNITMMQKLFSNIIIVLFGPFSALCILFILLSVNIQKRYVRKR